MIHKLVFHIGGQAVNHAAVIAHAHKADTDDLVLLFGIFTAFSCKADCLIRGDHFLICFFRERMCQRNEQVWSVMSTPMMGSKKEVQLPKIYPRQNRLKAALLLLLLILMFR